VGDVFGDDEGNVAVHPPPARGYLDTCLIAGFAKRDLENEQGSLSELLRLRREGRIELVTSSVAGEEIERYEGELRALQQDIYALLKEIPTVPEQSTDSGLMLMGVGGGTREDPVFTALKDALPGIDDARHVFQAVVNGVDYFVTNDRKSILSHAPAVESAVSIAIRLPSQVVAELAAADAES
jgi:hypothetical protein